MTFSKVFIFSFILLASILPRFNFSYNAFQIWQREGLTPDILPILPPELAEVQFTSGAVIATGQPLTLEEVSSQPFSISYPWDSNHLYTFIMFDPDVPSSDNTQQSEYAQWISVNNEGQSGTGFNTYSGDDVAPYNSPRPKRFSGKHRYIFLVFQQSYEIDVTKINRRTKFDYLYFASQNGLGNPIAGNFCLVYAENYNK